jgi:hypothetical protein
MVILKSTGQEVVIISACTIGTPPNEKETFEVLVPTPRKYGPQTHYQIVRKDKLKFPNGSTRRSQ